MAKDVDTDGVGFGTFEFDEETQSDLMDNGEIGESAITVCVSSAIDAIQTEVKGSCNNSYWISSFLSLEPLILQGGDWLR